MRKPYDVVIATPLPGRLRIGLRFSWAGITEAEWLPAKTPLRAPRTPRQKEAVAQLKEFLRDGKTRFSLSLDLQGTEHQLRVWRALLAIPPGKVKSYGDVAREIHSSPRAVGHACRTNPVPVVVPCHRVVSADGGLGGYMGAFTGDPLAIKEWLLRHEGAL
jgi:methylated-DNA-[protein]-cysteine S-methyltransferase